MDNNKMHATVVAANETAATEHVKGAHHHEGNAANKRNFGVLDLWDIRRGARVYRIHNRIPRV